MNFYLKRENLCRNLLGLKPWGILTWGIGFIVSGLRACSPLIGGGLPLDWNWLAASYLVVSLIMLIVLIFIVRPAWVRLVADEYSRQLLGAIDILKPQS